MDTLIDGQPLLRFFDSLRTNNSYSLYYQLTLVVLLFSAVGLMLYKTKRDTRFSHLCLTGICVAVASKCLANIFVLLRVMHMVVKKTTGSGSITLNILGVMNRAHLLFEVLIVAAIVLYLITQALDRMSKDHPWESALNGFGNMFLAVSVLIVFKIFAFAPTGPIALLLVNEAIHMAVFFVFFFVSAILLPISLLNVSWKGSSSDDYSL